MARIPHANFSGLPARSALALALSALPLTGLAQTDFISTRPGSGGAPVRSTLPGAVPVGAITLQSNDPNVLRQMRSRTCREVYGPPSSEVTYVGGPIIESRYGEASENDWERDSGSCIRRYDTTRTTAMCPEGQQGTIVEKRQYDVLDNDDVVDDTGWQEVSNTCAHYYVRSETESQSAACLPNQVGEFIQKRTYELWSDGTRRNHGPWTEAVNTCGYYVVREETETRNLECPVNMKGTLTESRTYELWSDGEKREHTPWTETLNTCAWYLVSTDTEQETVSCPAGQEGTKLRERSYELWSDGSKRNYGTWKITQDGCKVFMGMEYEWSFRYKKRDAASVYKSYADGNKIYDAWDGGKYWFGAEGSYFIIYTNRPALKAECRDGNGKICHQRIIFNYVDGVSKVEFSWPTTQTNQAGLKILW